MLFVLWGHLDEWGELASRKRLFNPPSQAVLKAGHPCVLKCVVVGVQVHARACS